MEIKLIDLEQEILTLETNITNLSTYLIDKPYYQHQLEFKQLDAMRLYSRYLNQRYNKLNKELK